MDNQLDHHAHINFLAIFLSAIGVGVITLGIFSISVSAKSSAPLAIQTSAVITDTYIKEHYNGPVEAITSVTVNEVQPFYSSVTILPE